jgi:hypothetical protein
VRRRWEKVVPKHREQALESGLQLAQREKADLNGGQTGREEWPAAGSETEAAQEQAGQGEAEGYDHQARANADEDAGLERDAQGPQGQAPHRQESPGGGEQQDQRKVAHGPACGQSHDDQTCREPSRQQLLARRATRNLRQERKAELMCAAGQGRGQI